MSIEKTIEAINRFNKFLIISHVDLEGDSIGSQFALKILLNKLGKEAIVVNEDRPPSHYDFLDIKDDIITDLDKDIDYEAIAVLDCPVIKRIGRAKKILDKDKILINIDHHISNNNFGDINWVEPDASSCGDMIYNLYKAFKIAIDYRSALFLYVAILTDTGSFAYENTSSDTHIIASELIKKGLKPDSIHQAIYENKSMPEVRLLGEALSTMKITEDKKISYMYVSKSMLDRLNLGLEVTEGFINYARSIKGVKVAIIFLEDPREKDKIQISFRSKGAVDVDRLASLFGGGGHKNASGCIAKGALKTVMEKVVDKVKNNI